MSLRILFVHTYLVPTASDSVKRAVRCDLSVQHPAPAQVRLNATALDLTYCCAVLLHCAASFVNAVLFGQFSCCSVNLAAQFLCGLVISQHGYDI